MSRRNVDNERDVQVNGPEDEAREYNQYEAEYGAYINPDSVKLAIAGQVLTNHEIAAELGFVSVEDGVTTPAFRHLQSVLTWLRNNGDIDVAIHHRRYGELVVTDYRYYLTAEARHLESQGLLGPVRWGVTAYEIDQSENSSGRYR